MKRYIDRHVLFVGPDRCWKTSMIRQQQEYYTNESYKGSRGDDALIRDMVEAQPKYFFDRGLVCDRAYNRLLKRDVDPSILPIKEDAEARFNKSNCVYVFMTRHSFHGVKDDVNPGYDLDELGRIYLDIIIKTIKRPVLTVYVDAVREASFKDREWVIATGKVLEYLSYFDNSIH